MSDPDWLSVKPMSFPIQSLNLAGLTLGNPNGAVVLCLHGWLDNAASFMPMFEQLIRTESELLKNFQFIAIDWPGHGLSDHRSKDAHYHFVDWAYDLLQLMEGQATIAGKPQRWQSVHLIGHSMGGMVATAFSSAFPEKVSNLMLIEAIGLITLTQSASAQLKQGFVSRLQANKKRKSMHSSVQSAISARMNVSDLPEHCAKLIVERALVAQDNAFAWRSDLRLRTISPQRFTIEQAIEMTSQITCSVTLVTGSHGFESINKAKQIFAMHLSDFNHQQIAGGHHPHMESPQKMGELVTTFLHKKLN